MDPEKRFVIFANPSGQNHCSLEFVEAFNKKDRVEFQVISLAERLAEYTNFPSPHRKKRLEEILSHAAEESAKTITEKIKDLDLSWHPAEVLKGKFPESVKKWMDTHNPDLLVKQTLHCDGEFGYTSKGDLNLSRHIAVPILLLNTKFTRDSSIIVGIPPLFHDNSGLSRVVRIIKHSLYWAEKLDSTLYFVHAWDLFGEAFLRSRFTKEELSEELKKAEENAKKEMDTAIEESRIPAHIDYKIHLHKGDPTRVLIAELELLKPTLMVMGSVANEGVKSLFLGNTAETLARRKITNTLIIK